MRVRRERCISSVRMEGCFGCESMMEFRAYVNNSFQSMVHQDDLGRVQIEINEQIAQSDEKLDHVKYRIIRKDGEVRWIDDWGHLVADDGNEKLYYVFISDVTNTITEHEKEMLLRKNEYY